MSPQLHLELFVLMKIFRHNIQHLRNEEGEAEEEEEGEV
jgi:hypothetical protein